MRPVTGSFLIIFLVAVMLPACAEAVPAITCHCFTDRSYDAARPALADPYFLATTQNSFFAVIFSVDKKTIVLKKQKGASPDDLWIAYLIASKTGASPESLLQAHQTRGLWHEVIDPLRLSSDVLGPRFSRALKARSTTAVLAEAVVDEQLIFNRLLSDGELAALRYAGASNQELIVAAVIAIRLKLPASQMFHEVKGGKKTWGSLLEAAKINPKDMQREISGMLQR